MKGLFLGAGFSHAFGMPLVWELTRELRGWLTPDKFRTINTEWRKKQGGYCDITVLKVIQLLEQRDIHYEWILGALEIEENRHENFSIRNELYQVRTWLLDVIFMLLHQRVVKNEQFIQSAIAMHRGFNSLIPMEHPFWIFNLNHDLVIEMLAAHFNIPLRNGFSEETVRIRFDYAGQNVANFKKLNASNGGTYPYNFFAHNVLQKERGINLLKIHGSLDIFGYDNLRQYLCIIPEEKSVKGYIQALNILIAGHTRIPLRPNNEILAFDNEGELQFLRKSLLSGVLKFGKQYQVMPLQILNVFKSNLGYVNELIIIGYGFADIHINLILKEWLELLSSRRIVIVDPYRETPPDFIGHLPSQISICKKTSVEYFSGLPGGELSEEESYLYEIRSKFRDR